MKKSPSCPKTFDLRMLRQAARGITSGQYADTTALQREMFPDIHPATVRCALCKIGLNGRVRRTKLFLSTTHKKALRIWAEEHHEWEVEAHWHNVVFSDESKFNLFGSDGRQYCRRRPGEEFLDRNVKKVVKHGGGSLMVWGCITPQGPGRLHRIEGRMNAVQYCEILTESFLGTLADQRLSPDNVIFQQDNDPKHTLRQAQE